MARLRWSTAGESHGAALYAVLDGVPFGLALDVAAIDGQLARRQTGFGRSARQRIERDHVEVVAGVVGGRSNGAPLVLRVANVDHSIDTLPPVHRPRPGHADLAGALKYLTDDARPVLERASARETAARVAAGAVAKQLLSRLGIEVDALVVGIGSVRFEAPPPGGRAWIAARDASPVACPDPAASAAMQDAIAAAGRSGDTLGGIAEVRAQGVPPGLGSLSAWDARLDARLAAVLMSVPSVKAVEIGDGIAAATAGGREVHDGIGYDDVARRIVRSSNRAGGIEGGMSNGEPIVARAWFKPLATTRQAAASIDLRDGSAAAADTPRSDVCAVPSGAVVAEHVVALVLLDAVLDAVGGETVEDLDRAFEAWRSPRAGLPRSRPERRGNGPSPRTSSP